MTARTAAQEIVETILAIDGVDHKEVAVRVARHFGLLTTEMIDLYPPFAADVLVRIAGRPGWKSDSQGREWYSSAWLNASAA